MSNLLSKSPKNNTVTHFHTENELVNMGIEKSAIVHIMERLTDLYSNPLEAVIRETVSNAIDATIESGEINPVKITIDYFSSSISISDNGTGMSYEELKNIYAMYGASTKKDNFNALGSYGLGAKAPLAYTNSFTITSVKDGHKTIAIITKTEKGPQMQIISSTMELEEKNGTIIEFSLEKFSDIDKSKRIVTNNYSLYKNMASVPIEIYGIDEDSTNFIKLDSKLIIQDEDEKIELDVFVTDNSYEELYFLNKSNYKLILEGWDYTPKCYTNSGVHIVLKPGIVDFNSARDYIIENDRYNRLIESIYNYLQNFNFAEESRKPVKQSSFNTNLLLKIYNKILSPDSIYALDEKIIQEYETFKDVKILFMPHMGDRRDLVECSDVFHFLYLKYLYAKSKTDNIKIIGTQVEKVVKFSKRLSEKFSNRFIFIDSSLDEKQFTDLGYTYTSEENIINFLKSLSFKNNKNNKDKYKFNVCVFKVKKDNEKINYDMEEKELTYNQLKKDNIPIILTHEQRRYYNKNYFNTLYNQNEKLKTFYVIPQNQNYQFHLIIDIFDDYKNDIYYINSYSNMLTKTVLSYVKNHSHFHELNYSEIKRKVTIDDICVTILKNLSIGYFMPSDVKYNYHSGKHLPKYVTDKIKNNFIDDMKNRVSIYHSIKQMLSYKDGTGKKFKSENEEFFRKTEEFLEKERIEISKEIKDFINRFLNMKETLMA